MTLAELIQKAIQAQDKVSSAYIPIKIDGISVTDMEIEIDTDENGKPYCKITSIYF